VSETTLRPDPERLAQRLKALRQERNLSHVALARLAGVSTRSIKSIEEGTIPRYDSVLRLASVFGESPREWLQLAGLNASDAQIERVLRRQRSEQTAAAFRPLSPGDYFRILESRISPDTPALMVAVILSRMALRGEDNRARTKDLLANGLRLALAVPFPADQFPPHIHPSLRGFYSQTYGHAYSFAKELQAMAPAGSRQVKLFKPRPERIMLVQPPALLNELRPCITRFFDKNRNPAGQHVTFYTRFTDGRPDRWTLVEPASGFGEESARAEESRSIWEGYVSELLESWQLATKPEKDSVQLPDSGDWQEVKF